MLRQSGGVLPQRQQLQSHAEQTVLPRQCSGPRQINRNRDWPPPPGGPRPSCPRTAAWGRRQCLESRCPLAQLPRGTQDPAELSGIIYFYLNDPPKALRCPGLCSQTWPSQGRRGVACVGGPSCRFNTVFCVVFPACLPLLPQRGRCRGEVQPQV